MTEAEWLACENPVTMWPVLNAPGKTRQLRLFATACCRSIWPLLVNPSSQNVVETAERHASGLTTDDELLMAADIANRSRPPSLLPGADRAFSAALLTAYSESNRPIYTDPSLGRYGSECFATPAGFAYLVSINVAHGLAEWLYEPHSEDFRPVLEEAFAWQASVLKDIFGNPFRPVTFSPSWRTDTAVALARQMYDSRDFGAMPILADALQDAGCDNEDILDHCRNNGPHVRGCWVVDLVLGKD